MKIKQEEYFSKLIGAIGQVLGDEESEWYIDLHADDADATDFLYALGAMVPTYVLSELQEEEKNVLDVKSITQFFNYAVWYEVHKRRLIITKQDKTKINICK